MMCALVRGEQELREDSLEFSPSQKLSRRSTVLERLTADTVASEAKRCSFSAMLVQCCKRFTSVLQS